MLDRGTAIELGAEQVAAGVENKVASGTAACRGQIVERGELLSGEVVEGNTPERRKRRVARVGGSSFGMDEDEDRGA